MPDVIVELVGHSAQLGESGATWHFPRLVARRHVVVAL